MCQLSLNLPFGLIHARNRPLGQQNRSGRRQQRGNAGKEAR